MPNRGGGAETGACFSYPHKLYPQTQVRKGWKLVYPSFGDSESMLSFPSGVPAFIRWPKKGVPPSIPISFTEAQSN